MRRAARTDENQLGIVAALCKVGCSVQSLAAVGCGVPDLLCWTPHLKQTLLIEVKNPNRLNGSVKNEFTEAQRKFAKHWKGPIAVVETVRQALGVVGYALDVPWED